MRKSLWRLAACAALLFGCSSTGFAAFTGVAGMGAPVDNMQPSLAMNYLVRIAGGGELGEVVPFAGGFAPAGWALADGQLLPIDQNLDLYQRLGTFYGGDGLSTFALPDLRGRTAVHRGTGVGLTNRQLGVSYGAEADVLSLVNLPRHVHNIPGTRASGLSGFIPQAFDNSQPSLALTYGVALTGNFPTNNVPQDPSWYGQVRMFAGSSVPVGFAPADGQVLPVNGNFNLVAILGNRYGGDGATTFGLPDLRGRTPIHVGGAGGGPTHSLASTAGTEAVTLNENHMPPHQHTLPAPVFSTSLTGSGQPFDNMQPSLALNYVVCLLGNHPSLELGATEPFLGEVALFAGDFAPAGWALAEGQLLSVDSFPTLFSVLGAAYGGDGVSTFALPDLRGRTIVGAGQGPGLTSRPRGATLGAELSTLTADQLPAHFHPYTDFDADFNSDGIVDGADLLVWQMNFERSSASHQLGNADDDNDVDAYDLAIWGTQFGGPVPHLGVVPEPATSALAYLSAAGLFAWRTARFGDQRGSRCLKPIV